MKRKRFSEEQIIAILKEHEAGVAVAELCRKHGVSDASIYKWKAKFGGMDVSEAKRLKQLEDENAKLKRLLADAMLDNTALKDILGKMVMPAARRDAVAHLETAFEMSERRACKILGCCRMTVRYKAIRVADVALRDRMKAIARERRRFGYRRLHVLLRREGYVVNHERLFSGSIARKSSPCAAAAVASGRWERARLCWFRWRPTNAGAPTSSRIR